MQAIAPKNDAHFVNQEDEVNINDPKESQNSEVKLTSHAYYDPSDKVSETKWKKLLDFPTTHWDYKKYDPKTWEFSDTYKKVFNGNYPPEFSDNKKWLMDVDRFIHTVVPSNTDLLEECRPFTKMIPLFLNEMVQEKLRKKNSQQFKI
ncbi:unnamed protein product, partial [Brassica napus]